MYLGFGVVFWVFPMNNMGLGLFWGALYDILEVWRWLFYGVLDGYLGF